MQGSKAAPLILLGPGKPYLRAIHEEQFSRPTMLVALLSATAYGVAIGSAVTAWLMW